MKLAILLGLGLLQSQADETALLARHYHDGEHITYQMHGVNQGHQRTFKYDARADGLVKQGSNQTYFEEFAWSDFRVNGAPFDLSPASAAFREDLSLDTRYQLSIPDLSKVQPILIGPITDLLAFYSDVQLAMKQKNIQHAGDHAFFKHGVPNSWADGSYVVNGQDAVDFDITLESIDKATQTAKVTVRHLPPSQSQLKLPVAWMESPVGGTPNNWIEVEKDGNGKLIAQVGMETFRAELRLSLTTGAILGATMDNPVEVLERDCDETALTTCGTPQRYSIRRQIQLEAITPAAK